MLTNVFVNKTAGLSWKLKMLVYENNASF